MPLVPDITKVAEKNYRRQFYYRGYQQYGTGKSEFDDITDCVVTMLQAHADKEAKDQEEAGTSNSSQDLGMANNEHIKTDIYIPEEIQ